MKSINSKYIEAVQDIVTQQIDLLGIEVVKHQNKNIEGLDVYDDGKVRVKSTYAQEILQLLVSNQYNLSGLIFRNKIEPILDKYPDLAIYIS